MERDFILGLFREKQELNDRFDLDKLYDIACEQNIIFPLANEYPNLLTHNSFRNKYGSLKKIIEAQLSFKDELKELQKRYNFLVFKGMVLSEIIYGVNDARNYGDIDVLFKNEQAMLAFREYLIENGFKTDYEYLFPFTIRGHESSVYKTINESESIGIDIQRYTNAFDASFVNAIFENTMVLDSEFATPDLEFTFLILVLNAYEDNETIISSTHLSYNLKNYYDLHCFLKKHYHVLDKKKIKKYINKFGLSDRVMRILCNYYQLSRCLYTDLYIPEEPIVFINSDCDIFDTYNYADDLVQWESDFIDLQFDKLKKRKEHMKLYKKKITTIDFLMKYDQLKNYNEFVSIPNYKYIDDYDFRVFKEDNDYYLDIAKMDYDNFTFTFQFIAKDTDEYIFKEYLLIEASENKMLFDVGYINATFTRREPSNIYSFKKIETKGIPISYLLNHTRINVSDIAVNHITNGLLFTRVILYEKGAKERQAIASRTVVFHM